MALTFKKRDDLDKVLDELAALPPQVEFTDPDKNEKVSDKKIKSPEDFLKKFETPQAEKDKSAHD